MLGQNLGMKGFRETQDCRMQKKHCWYRQLFEHNAQTWQTDKQPRNSNANCNKNKKAQLTLTNPRDSKGRKNCSTCTCFVSFHRIPFPQISNYQCIDWLIEHGFTSAPTQYRLYGRRFLQVWWPNQHCQSTEGGWLVIQTGLPMHSFTRYVQSGSRPILLYTVWNPVFANYKVSCSNCKYLVHRLYS